MAVRLRLIGCGAVLLAVARWLVSIDVGAPGLADLRWRSLAHWYEQAGPVPPAVSLLRAVALAMVAWLVVAVVLQLAATVPGLGRLRTLADSLSPAVIRRVGGGVMSLSVTVGVGAPAGLDLPATDPPRDPVAVMVLVDWSSDQAPVVALPPEPAAPARPVPVAPQAPASAAVVSVEAGDSLWSIAEAALVDATGVRPTDAEVVRYWERLIAANRAALVDPANPDLIYPGQSFRLPDR